MSNKLKTVIGYKFAHANESGTEIDVIVTLEIPLENNAHNMNRPSIADRPFAKMRVSNLLFDGKTHLHRVYEQDVETDVTKIGLRDAFELAAGGEDVEPARLSYETAH